MSVHKKTKKTKKTKKKQAKKATKRPVASSALLLADVAEGFGILEVLFMNINDRVGKIEKLLVKL